MKSRNIVLLALAIGCGLVAAFLTAKLGASSKQDTVPVLVAAKNIDQGTRLDKPEELFIRKPFTKDAVPPEFIDDLNQLRGKVLQRTLRPGSHCTLDDITPHTEVDLPVHEKTGEPYRAMGIKVTQETAVAGLIKPGSRVDVVCVERLPNGRTASTMILQYALVVSVNDQIKPSAEAGVIKNVSNVTLAVLQQEGIVLALAAKRGELSLLLRSKDDKSKTAKVRTIDSLGGERINEDGTPAQPEYPTIPVALKPIPAGTKITDPAEWFKEQKILEIPKNAIAQMEDLKGKTLTKDVFENSWVAAEAFQGEVPAPGKTEAVGASKIHTVGVQVGSSSPQYFQFKDGVLQPNDEHGSKTHEKAKPEPKPESKPESKPDTKPEIAKETSKSETAKNETK